MFPFAHWFDRFRIFLAEAPWDGKFPNGQARRDRNRVSHHLARWDNWLSVKPQSQPLLSKEISGVDQSSTTQGILWIDAVGGFLVCLEDAVDIGQSVPGSEVQIPIVGDLSRKHATILRGSEGYILVPHALTRVRGKVVEGPWVLRDGDPIQLGERVELRFRVPHPLSYTACLDRLSRHRIAPSVDGVILMANTCVLGPGPQNHVICRDWSETITLARSPDGFRFRTSQRVEVDGIASSGVGTLTWSSRLSGENFTLSLERG